MASALIVGTGDMAYGLSRQFSLHAADADDEEIGSKFANSLTKHTVEVASTSGGSNEGFFHDTIVPMVDITLGLGFADIVILAIPSSAIQGFVDRYFDQIKDKIIVDITNPSKKNQNVRSALEEVYKIHGIDYEVRWVKGLNDIGALELITRKASSKTKMSTVLSGDDPKALETVKSLLEEAFSFDVNAVIRSSFAKEMEENQASIGWEWIHTFYIMLFIHAATYSYISVRVIKGFGASTDGLPAYIMNRAFGSTAITGFALTQIPGIFANFLRTFRGRQATFPKLLLWSLAIRKHMGLASFFSLCAHAILSCLVFGPAYHSRFFDPITNRLLLYPELSFLFATLGFCCYGVVAIASLPSVGASMNFRQWDFVFGKFIWLSLSFGILHAVLLGVKGWNTAGSRPIGMPSPTLMSSVLPMFVVAMKLIQVVMCWLCRLCKATTRPTAKVTKRGIDETKSYSQHTDSS